LANAARGVVVRTAGDLAPDRTELSDTEERQLERTPSKHHHGRTQANGFGGERRRVDPGLRRRPQSRAWPL